MVLKESLTSPNIIAHTQLLDRIISLDFDEKEVPDIPPIYILRQPLISIEEAIQVYNHMSQIQSFRDYGGGKPRTSFLIPLEDIANILKDKFLCYNGRHRLNRYKQLAKKNPDLLVRTIKISNDLEYHQIPPVERRKVHPDLCKELGINENDFGPICCHYMDAFKELYTNAFQMLLYKKEVEFAKNYLREKKCKAA